MADLNEDLETAIRDLAKKAAGSGSPGVITAAAGAAKDLAEALAWLDAPAQSH